MPHDCFTLDLPYESDGEDGRPRSRSEANEFIGCYMTLTTKINAKPPIITRVCRKSRSVAFETGALLNHKHMPGRRDDSGLSNCMRMQWVHHARDTVVQLHFNTLKDAHFGSNSATGKPIRILRDAVPLARIGSISKGFLSCHDKHKWKESRELPEGMKRIMMCWRVVCIHVDTEPATQSGLFGRLGEERVVMVDALDDERVGQFRGLWENHDQRQTVSPTTSIKQNAESRVVPGRPTVQEVLEEIRVCWLRDRWYDGTGPWVTELHVGGGTGHSWHESKVPGLVKEQVGKKHLLNPGVEIT